MNAKGIQVSIGLFSSLHKELLAVFAKQYAIEIKTLTGFQLYGFSNYTETLPNLKGFILEVTGQQINGKYIYNKLREIEKGNNKFIRLRKDYLSILILAIGYDNYGNYLKHSPFISDAVRQEEKNHFEETDKAVAALYYVGYYVIDKQLYVKSKFTIFKLKTAIWEIFNWEKRDHSTFYTYYGKCVSTGGSALSFYFSKENSSLGKECFVNLFYGNMMQTKPVLLGAYCGFDKSNNPVVGKMILEQVQNAETQHEKVVSETINPVFYYHLYSQRIEVDGNLPHKASDLSTSINRIEIINFLIGDYLGFYLDTNNYLIPLFFQVCNELGTIKLKVNNTKFEGIGRMNRSENYLVSEFRDNEDNFSQFSIQVQPLERDLFLGHLLIYYGTNVLNGKVLLWKENEALQKLMKNNKAFYLNKNDLEELFIHQISTYL
ncbi:MAG: hypothetical protein AB8G86_24260 [Saprospiraceae bacterium]